MHPFPKPFVARCAFQRPRSIAQWNWHQAFVPDARNKTTQPMTVEQKGAVGAELPDVIYLPDETGQPVKKGRSGSAKRKRQAAVLVRMLPAQLERIIADAAAAKMTVPEYLLTGRLTDDVSTPRRHRRIRAPADEAALMRALVAFNRANNNLNQLAHAGNRLALLSEQHRGIREDVSVLSGAVDRLREEFSEPVAAILEALGVREG